MWLYLLIFFIPVFFYQFSGRNARTVPFLAMMLGFLALFVGMSDMLGGYDRYIYGEVFDSIANTTTARSSYLLNGAYEFFPKEPGYIWLNIIISWFTENRYIFILLLTLIIYSLLFVSLRRYAVNYPFAVIVFLGLWFFFSFTYLRQVLGATVAWLSLPYIIKRKPVKFFIVALIAMSIHKSAIIFMPVYFVAHLSWSRRTIELTMIAALLLGLSPIPNMLFSAYGDMSQVEMQSDYSATGRFRFAYFLEAAFFLWIIWKNYDGFNNCDRQTRVLLNMALIFCALLLFFIRSENGGRLTWYYMIGIVCTLTTIAMRIRNVHSLAPLLIVVMLFLYIRIFDAWQGNNNYLLNLYPYKTFLSPGYRVGDYSYEHYEYDKNYTTDKLYRRPVRFDINIKY